MHRSSSRCFAGRDVCDRGSIGRAQRGWRGRRRSVQARPRARVWLAGRLGDQQGVGGSARAAPSPFVQLAVRTISLCHAKTISGRLTEDTNGMCPALVRGECPPAWPACTGNTPARRGDHASLYVSASLVFFKSRGSESASCTRGARTRVACLACTARVKGQLLM